MESIEKKTSKSDIDQLCDLIDENTFGFVSISKSFSSIPSCQVKAFRLSRLKRLKSSKLKTKSDRNDDENHQDDKTSTISRRISMRYSLSSSLVNRFRRLTTRSRHSSRSTRTTLTLYRTESTLADLSEENSAISTCSIVDTRRTTTSHSCNVEELAAYLDNYLYLPKSLSGAAELMYT